MAKARLVAALDLPPPHAWREPITGILAIVGRTSIDGCKLLGEHDVQVVDIPAVPGFKKTPTFRRSLSITSCI